MKTIESQQDQRQGLFDAGMTLHQALIRTTGCEGKIPRSVSRIPLHQHGIQNPARTVGYRQAIDHTLSIRVKRRRQNSGCDTSLSSTEFRIAPVRIHLPLKTGNPRPESFSRLPFWKQPGVENEADAQAPRESLTVPTLGRCGMKPAQQRKRRDGTAAKNRKDPHTGTLGRGVVKVAADRFGAASRNSAGNDIEPLEREKNLMRVSPGRSVSMSSQPWKHRREDSDRSCRDRWGALASIKAERTNHPRASHATAF